ncbi:putative secreted protein [Metarhizium anisopliae]
MKFNNAILLALATTVLAAPASDVTTPKRQDINTVTDQLLFSSSLPQFEARRNANDPPLLDWSSDGCTSSPDNPFGFPFLPACHRHDFGYQNYRIQTRFTKAAKAKIDSNFKSELADVYYEAVKEFGGGDATKRDRSDFDRAVAAYNAAVKEAQEQGLLPVLD